MLRVHARPWWEYLTDLFFEPHCPGCDRVGFGFCPSCAAEIMPLRVEYRGLTTIHAAGYYKGALRNAIVRLKKLGHTYLHYALALRILPALSNRLINSIPICCVPMPGAPARTRQRGYHCPTLLARELARQIPNLQVLPQALQLRRETREQKELGRVERFANVRGLYQATSAVQDRYVLLIDDVMTTGATIFSAVESLYNSGAARVDTAVAAIVESSQND